MGEISAEPKIVVVAGDVTIDWNLGRIPLPPDPRMPGKRGTSTMSFEPGGAALLGKLLTAIAKDIEEPGGEGIDVRTVGDPAAPRPGDGVHNHSYAIWSLHDRETGKGDSVWRIAQALGVEDATQGSSPVEGGVVDDSPSADLVVLDAGLGGNQPKEEWPRAIISPDSSPHVVLKMACPVGEGPLWDHLVSHHAERLIAVVRANDLRIAEAQISRELSWEQSAQDLLWEITYNPELKRLSHCAHLIVSFGTSGAMLLSNPKDGTKTATLYFDPRVMEEEWAERYPGKMVGYTVCLTAAVAREIMRADNDSGLGEAIKRGLKAMRSLHGDGFEVVDETMPRVRFPAERIAQSMSRDEEDLAAGRSPIFAESPARLPSMSVDRATDRWTILEELFPEGLEQVARKIVLFGPDSIVSKVPVAEFGKLQTVDRTEVEGYRSVRSLIAQYAALARPERPLSIAVFGRPGSGKSFGIKQVAQAMLPGRIETMTFNLSQLHDPDQLLDAFHQVRDVSLKGKLPLVFWDEFDATLGSDGLGWLKHFLAPMQDGEFQQDQLTHHIGAAIFVFAGGTRETMLDFSKQFEGELPEELANAKGRDFVSRLKGYVDVAGPNPIGSTDDDPHYVIRRAILLRSMLGSKKDLIVKRGKKKELQIDGGVLRAFLKVEKYNHGARSIESVIAMSLLNGKSRFERSALPAAEQLGIHVTSDFLKIVRSLVIEGRMLRELSEAVHVVYCALMLDDGYTWAESDDGYLDRNEALRRFVGHERDPERTTSSLVAYENLDEEIREQNEDFARDIPNKVESIGYEVVLGRGDERDDAFPVDLVESLAEQEHDRWMRLKLRQGWSWGLETDNERRLQPAMLPWREVTGEERVQRYGGDGASRIGTEVLPESEKNKDRALIKAVTKILADNGFRAERT